MMKEGGGENNFDLVVFLNNSLEEEWVEWVEWVVGFPFDVNRSKSESKENCTIRLVATLEQI